MLRNAYALATLEEDRATKLQGCDTQGRLWLSRALETLQYLEKDNKHVSLAVDVDEEIVADRAKASKALKAVREVGRPGLQFSLLNDVADRDACS